MTKARSVKGSSNSVSNTEQHPLARYQPDGINAGHSGYMGAKHEQAKRLSHLEAQLEQRWDDANARLKADKVGVAIKRVATKSGYALSLQFTSPEGRKNIGCGVKWNAEGIALAEQYARKVGNKLLHKEFTTEWYNREILKEVEPTEPVKKAKTIGELIADFKAHFDATHQPGQRSVNTQERNYNIYLKRFNPDTTLSQDEIKRVIESTKSNSANRARCLMVIKSFIKFVGELPKYADVLETYKGSCKYERKERKIPKDEAIEVAFATKFIPNKRCKKDNLDSYPQWQWVFGIMATYGLRDHEVWTIENLFEPTEFKGQTIPALNDPSNTQNLIIVDGKTGRRLAMPVSPKGKNWVELFDLKNPKPKEIDISGYKAGHLAYGNALAQKFDESKIAFTPYDLRHAFNHRCRENGIDTSTAALTMGHSEMMNSSTYKRHMKAERVVSILTNAIEAQKVVEAKLDLEQAMAQAIALMADDSLDKSEALSKLLAAIYGLSQQSAIALNGGV